MLLGCLYFRKTVTLHAHFAQATANAKTRKLYLRIIKLLLEKGEDLDLPDELGYKCTDGIELLPDAIEIFASHGYHGRYIGAMHLESKEALENLGVDISQMEQNLKIHPIEMAAIDDNLTNVNGEKSQNQTLVFTKSEDSSKASKQPLVR